MVEPFRTILKKPEGWPLSKAVATRSSEVPQAAPRLACQDPCQQMEDAANSLWARARLQLAKSDVVQVLCSEAVAKTTQFNSQQIANTLGKLAKLNSTITML